MRRLGIFGCGFTGRAVARMGRGEGVAVWGTTRSAENTYWVAAAGALPILFEGTESEALRDALSATTHLVVSIAPPRSERPDGEGPVDPVLRTLGADRLRELAPSLSWIAYLSTVGVYGDHGGAWVDEESETRPVSARSRQRVRAEGEWRAFADEAGLPLATLRLSGIYGPGRNGLKSAAEGRTRRLVKSGQVFNRIHVDDIARAVWLAARRGADGVFNITDDEPAPPQDVVAFAHDLLGTEPPPEQDFETADLSPMARSFYGENKRVSNAKSKRMLGLEYQWPNYRAALEGLLLSGYAEEPA